MEKPEQVLTDANSEPNSLVASPAPFSGGWPQKIWFLWATVVVPLASFAFVLDGLHLVGWQDPDLSARAMLLVDRPGAIYFAPLAALVMVACVAAVFRPGPWLAGPYGRPLLWLGVGLGVQYSLLVPASLTLESPWPEILAESRDWGAWLLTIVGIEVGSVALVMLWRWLYRKLPLRIFVGLLGGLAVTAAILLGRLSLGENYDLSDLLEASLVNPLFSLCALSLIGGPIWASDCLLRLLWRLGRPTTFSVPAALTAAVAWLAAWRFAVVSAIEAYEKLPKDPPGCFLATAAARAPVCLCGGFDARTADGRTFRVSPQLQRFKLFELALREAAPGVHRSLRRVYDRLGPKLASLFSRPSSAALLWLALKPLEAVAVALLQLCGGVRLRQAAARLYRS